MEDHRSSRRRYRDTGITPIYENEGLPPLDNLMKRWKFVTVRRLTESRGVILIAATMDTD